MIERVEFKSDQVPLVHFETLNEYTQSFGSDRQIGYAFDYDQGNFRAVMSQTFYETGEIKWADAVFWDKLRGISVYYDHNYITKCFEDERKDGSGPYKGVVFIRGELPIPNFPSDLGHFYYDENGKIGAIKVGDPIDDPMMPHLRFAKFDKKWKVYRFADANEEIFAMADAAMKNREYSKEIHLACTLEAGEEVIFDEVSYRVDGNESTLTLATEVSGGLRKRLVEVPAAIDLNIWKEILSSENWTEILKKYPVRILVEY